jgi:hypothetical protein
MATGFRFWCNSSSRSVASAHSNTKKKNIQLATTVQQWKTQKLFGSSTECASAPRRRRIVHRRRLPWSSVRHRAPASVCQGCLLHGFGETACARTKTVALQRKDSREPEIIKNNNKLLENETFHQRRARQSCMTRSNSLKHSSRRASLSAALDSHDMNTCGRKETTRATP